MSYRPVVQALEPGINQTIEGIEKLTKSIEERIKSGDWSTTHITELHHISMKLTKLKLELMMLSRETW